MMSSFGSLDHLAPLHHPNSLAPLAYLEGNHKRGSITDPSLHHASPTLARPNPAYTFPRRMSGSPSQGDSGHSGHSTPSSHHSDNTTTVDPPRETNTGNDQQSRQRERDDEDDFGEFTMRRLPRSPLPRTSLPLPLPSSSLKRKMSHDRAPYESGNGIHFLAPMPLGDVEAPPPKRRSSMFDTRISQLSLNERRDSLDSRMSWAGRRDSAASLYSTGSGPPSSTFSSSEGTTGGTSLRNGWGNSPVSSYHKRDGSLGEYYDERNTARIPVLPTVQFPFNQPDPYISESGSSAPYEQDHRRLSVPDLQGATNKKTKPSSRRSQSPEFQQPAPPGTTPYSRSPELRVSHKMAERKRRKEMKELFDELRDHLPADRGMKASKWEILTKAVDYIGQLKGAYDEAQNEIEMLRRERESWRGGGGPPPPPRGGSPGPNHGHHPHHHGMY